MKCKCPACGAVFSLDVLLQHEQASQAVFNALQLNGEFGRLVVQYLGLFRPAKSSLSMERVAKLLNELLVDVNAGQIQRKGQTIHAPLSCWIEGLNTVLNQRHSLTLPLSSHGYLYEVMSKWQDKTALAVPPTAELYPAHSHRTFNGNDGKKLSKTPSKTAQAIANLAEFAHG